MQAVARMQAVLPMNRVGIHFYVAHPAPPCATAGVRHGSEAVHVNTRQSRKSWRTPYSRQSRDREGALAKCVASKRSLTDRKSTRLNSSHLGISYAVFCLKKKKNKTVRQSYKHETRNTPSREDAISVC